MVLPRSDRRTPYLQMASVLLPLVAALAACGNPDDNHGSPAGECGAARPSAHQMPARVVFVGVMLSGPTAHTRSGDVLISPARMRVDRYLKGSGPKTVRVRTALQHTRSGTTVNADGIQPHAGGVP